MYYGNKKIADAYYGNVPLKKIYYGSTLVWEKRKTSGLLGEHQWVDLGLPSGTYWATMNVGAEYPYEEGDLYAWGEVETKDEYTVDNSQFHGKDFRDFAGEYRYDAAYRHWGYEIDPRYFSWRMPSKQHIDELVKYCTTEIIDYSEINPDFLIGGKVCRVTGPNGNSILFSMNKQSLWTSIQVPEELDSDFEWAYSLAIYDTVPTNFVGHIATARSTKDCGLCVRPVFESGAHPNYFIPYNKPPFKELSSVKLGEGVYIDTGIDGNSNDIEIHISWIKPETSVPNSVLFANFVDDKTKRWMLWFDAKGLLRFSNNSLYSSDSAGDGYYAMLETGAEVKAVLNKDGLYLNGAYLYLSHDGSSENHTSIKLGNPTSLEYTTTDIQILNFRIFKNGICLCNLVPVTRNSNNEPYMFDTISRKYFSTDKK